MRFVGVKVGVGQSIDIDKNNTFPLSSSSIKTVGAIVLGGLCETNLRCVRSSGIFTLIVSEISAFIRTDGHG